MVHITYVLGQQLCSAAKYSMNTLYAWRTYLITAIAHYRHQQQKNEAMVMIVASFTLILVMVGLIACESECFRNGQDQALTNLK